MEEEGGGGGGQQASSYIVYVILTLSIMMTNVCHAHTLPREI